MMNIDYKKLEQLVEKLPEEKVGKANLVAASNMSPEEKDRWMKGWIQELFDEGLLKREDLFGSKEKQFLGNRSLFDEVFSRMSKEAQGKLIPHKDEIFKSFCWINKTLDDDVKSLELLSHKLIMFAIKKDGLEKSKDVIKKIAMFQGYDYDSWKD